MSEGRPFEREFLLLWVKDDPDWTCTLKNARVQRLGRRTFIVGEYFFSEIKDARAGLTAWIPVDDIVILTEYPNLERVNEARAEWKEQREKPASKRGWFS